VEKLTVRQGEDLSLEDFPFDDSFGNLGELKERKRKKECRQKGSNQKTKTRKKNKDSWQI